MTFFTNFVYRNQSDFSYRLDIGIKKKSLCDASAWCENKIRSLWRQNVNI